MSDDDMPSHHGPGYTPEGEYPNETIRLLFERASCRDYSDQEVPPEVLGAVLEAGTHAPTGGRGEPAVVRRAGRPEVHRGGAGPPPLLHRLQAAPALG
jgi:nitroreductase